MAPSPTDKIQTAEPGVSVGSWAATDQRPLCQRGSDGRRRHCLHHRHDLSNLWSCCRCPHTRTDEQAADPNWREEP